MNHLRLAFAGLVLGFVAAQSVGAAIIWSGPDKSVTQPDDSPLTVTDTLVPGVASLTRGEAGLLCNVLNGDDCEPNLYLNPTDFEWAFSGLNGNGAINYGDAVNHAGLIFDDLDDALEIFPRRNAPGAVGVGRIVSQDVYFDIEFFSWESEGGGGFSYRRSTAAVPEPSILGLMAVGLAGFGFAGRKRQA